MKSQLLPEGFRDGLPDLAEIEYKINSIFLDLMRSNGYMLVKPPLVEFESSLFFLNNDNENIDSFRVMDPLTQKIMGIRSDITMQIARISCGSLSNITRPLRLSYSGEILKVKNTNINLSRQFTQIGAEIIGVDENYCLSEIINLVIENLKCLKIRKFIINFSMPNLIKLISKEFNLDEHQYKLVENCFKNKNLFQIKEISEDLFNISEFLLANIGSIDEKIDIIKRFNFPKSIKLEINNFINQIKKIKDEFSNHQIIIDLLEIDESNYHNGFNFTVYSENSKELFSGGGYKVQGENCVGFSGLIENFVSETLIKRNIKDKIFVPFNLFQNKKEILKKKKNLVVIMAIKKLNKRELNIEAIKQNCKYYYFNDEIYEVKND